MTHTYNTGGNDRIDHMFDLQEALQSDTYGDGLSPRNFTNEGKIAFIQTNILALTDELHEALAEVGWKPWASSRHINEDAFKGELVDAFHFFMNLCITVGLDPQELYVRYIKKRAKNIARQEEGYDGVSTKCPQCKKALDDDAVNCYITTTDGKTPARSFCATHGSVIPLLPKRPTDYQGYEPKDAS
jgi:dimeric dUTPase (all-alpha-NTP-PPase superfamily)